MPTLKLVYFGTPDFSAQILEAAIKDPQLKVVAVVTQKDKPVGRKKIITPSPVAQLAVKHNIPVFKPHKLDRPNLEHLKLFYPDIFLVAAYGQIFPKNWLEAPKIATLNIHFSLLPKYRGALCVSESLKNQDQETGVTLMKMDKKLDHGPIIAQAKQKISPNDDVATLTQKLTQKAISLLPNIRSSELRRKATPQDHKKATYTPSLKTRTRQSAYIPTSKIYPPEQIKQPRKLHALIRSLNPDPGAWTKIQDQELKIIKTRLEKDRLKITRVQLPGKTPITWQQFQQGHRS